MLCLNYKMGDSIRIGDTVIHFIINKRNKLTVGIDGTATAWRDDLIVSYLTGCGWTRDAERAYWWKNCERRTAQEAMRLEGLI